MAGSNERQGWRYMFVAVPVGQNVQLHGPTQGWEFAMRDLQDFGAEGWEAVSFAFDDQLNPTVLLRQPIEPERSGRVA